MNKILLHLLVWPVKLQYFLQFFCKVHHSIKKSLAIVRILTAIKISAATIICPKENAMKNGQKEKKNHPLENCALFSYAMLHFNLAPCDM